MKKLTLAICLILCSSILIFAQNNACPVVKIEGPKSTVDPGDVIKFSVSLDKEYPNVKYRWKIDKGRIISGQGTNEISIDSTGLSDETLTATVNLGDFPINCVSEFSEVGIIAGLPIVCYFPDEFGNIKDNDVRARIDAIITELTHNPDLIAYVINYGKPYDVYKRQVLITNHLIFREFDSKRFHFVNGGKEEKIRTRIFRIPTDTDLSELN